MFAVLVSGVLLDETSEMRFDQIYRKVSNSLNGTETICPKNTWLLQKGV